MSARERYILETAALLHDIGKIGVPDSILLKPGPLTADEWKINGRPRSDGCGDYRLGLCLPVAQRDC